MTIYIEGKVPDVRVLVYIPWTVTLWVTCWFKRKRIQNYINRLCVTYPDVYVTVSGRKPFLTNCVVPLLRS